jgi:GNAT superfamily N-acetyltransferase
MLTPHIRIRLASAADADELARLRWDFSPDEIAASGQIFDEFRDGFRGFAAPALASGNWAVWVAEERQRLRANIWVEIIPKVPRPGRFGARWGYVTNVYTEPDLRGQGVGTRLLESVIAWAREERLEILIVWPSEESIRFYERAGFHLSPDALELHLDD